MLKVTDSQFREAWKSTGGSARETSKLLGISERATHSRRRSIEALGSERLISYQPKSPDKQSPPPPGRITYNLSDGLILVGSDVHIWPGPLTTAQRAFIHLAKKLKPSVIVINGDLFDGALVSRFPAGMWSQEKRPNVRQELEACQAFTGDLEAIAGAKLFWAIGNHDMRFEARLAALTPEYEGVPGFALKDHFPRWQMGMSLWVNDDLVIKHRWKGGLHAPHRNTVESGRSICTGHLHSLKVMPWTDYNGDRFGIDCGTLSDTSGPQFDYCEDNPRNWRAGFAVLSIRESRLLIPELVQVWDEDRVQFRGELIKV